MSLTAAANRSLDMSRSLTEKCARLADLQLVDDSSSLLPLGSADYNLQSPNNQSVFSVDDKREVSESLNNYRQRVVSVFYLTVTFVTSVVFFTSSL